MKPPLQAGNNTKMSDLLPRMISGQISFTLAIDFGAGIQRMQQVVESVVKLLAAIARRPPAREAELLSKHVFKLSLAVGSRLIHKRLSLLTLPNGDIRRSDQVQIFVPLAVDVDEDQVKLVVA